VVAPHLAIYDASAALGGALTSVAALAEVWRARGGEASLASVSHAAERDAGVFDHWAVVGPARFGDVQRGPYFAREVARARALRQHWRRVRPDLVLLNNGPTTNLAGLLAARSLGLPTAQYVRGPLGPTHITRAALRDVDAVFTVGAHAWEAGAPLNVCTIRADEGLAASQWPTPRDKLANDWLFAASGHSWKGAKELIEAYARVRRSQVLPRLWICLTRGASLDPVTVPSRLPGGVQVLWEPRQLDGLRRRCRAFLHNSQRPEPFGRALLEGMAAGLCPVAPREGGPAQLVEHEVSGRLFTPRDPATLDDTLRWLARSSQVDELGARAAKRALAYRAERVFAPVLRMMEDLTDCH
jgi:hypothetical protein